MDGTVKGKNKFSVKEEHYSIPSLKVDFDQVVASDVCRQISETHALLIIVVWVNGARGQCVHPLSISLPSIHPSCSITRTTGENCSSLKYLQSTAIPQSSFSHASVRITNDCDTILCLFIIEIVQSEYSLAVVWNTAVKYIFEVSSK